MDVIFLDYLFKITIGFLLCLSSYPFIYKFISNDIYGAQRFLTEDHVFYVFTHTRVFPSKQQYTIATDTEIPFSIKTTNHSGLLSYQLTNKEDSVLFTVHFIDSSSNHYLINLFDGSIRKLNPEDKSDYGTIHYLNGHQSIH